MLLNWCDYGTNDYDLGAVFLLRPRAIFLLTHLDESANSEQFHRYLRKGEGRKRYFVRKRFNMKGLSGSTKEAEHCREHHQSYVIEWLVDSEIDNVDNKVTLEKTITCRSTDHTDHAEKLLMNLSNL